MSILDEAVDRDVVTNTRRGHTHCNDTQNNNTQFTKNVLLANMTITHCK